jgi:ABC-2 type transport system ATP-binding protein
MGPRPGQIAGLPGAVVKASPRIHTASTAPPGAPAAILAERISRRFGRTEALREVSLEVRRGEIHSLLGPNGAGKTTLLRILAGLVDADAGEIRIGEVSVTDLRDRPFRQLIGLVPSGDRSFYLRISGLENLVFFARLHGLSFRRARQRARECLAAVGLADAAGARVGVYSHGMQKRLSVARALLMDPPLLLVDEATHDLDPQGALQVRHLLGERARQGAAVIWATQRIDEIRRFAHRVTLLHRGRVRFRGGVPEFMAMAGVGRHLLHVRDGADVPGDVLGVARSALGGMGTIVEAAEGEGGHYLVALPEDITLGEALTRLVRAGIEVLACREERSEIEEAFLRLTEEDER